MKQSILLGQLINESQQIQERAEEILDLPLEQLTKRPNESAWNTLEVFEHLNYYVILYNGFIQKALDSSPPSTGDQNLQRGYWGNRFIKMMEPKDGGIKKMKTFKSKDPMGKTLSKQTIQQFIESNQQLMHLIETAKTRDISKTKSQLAIPLLKLKLADAMGFIVAHNARHMLQIENNLA